MVRWWPASRSAGRVTGLHPGQDHLGKLLARDGEGIWSAALKGVVNAVLAFANTTGQTFYGDIVWMSDSRVTLGCNPPDNDLFCPDDPMTRGQLAAFLRRALGEGRRQDAIGRSPI